MKQSATIDKREVDVNGFVRVLDNPISVEGIYQYISPPGSPEQNKVYRVYRPAEELSREETLKSLYLKPIIDLHPDAIGMLGNNPGAVTAEEHGIHGVVSEKVYFKDGMVYADLMIHSSSLMDKIDITGIKELSAGYWANYDYTPGIWNGQPYDAIQKDIIFNHVALVPEGRMGSSVSVQDSLPQPTEEANMHDQAKLAELKQAVATLASLLENFFSEESTETAVTDSEEEKEDKEKTEDAEESEEEKEKTEDSDEDKEDKDEDKEKSGSMDSSEMQRIIDLAVKSALSQVKERDNLYSKLKPHIGVMDASDMTVDQLAKYATTKLGIKTKAGQEVGAIEGYLAVSKKSTQDQLDDIGQAQRKFKAEDYQ